MSPNRRPRVIRTAGLLIVALCALALAGCSGSSTAGGTSSQPGAAGSPTPTVGTAYDQPVPPSVSAIEFTNQDGARVSLDSLHGKTVVLTDFLTLCQEICPLTSANFQTMATDARKAKLGSQIEFVEVTVDPDRDRVARLAAYQKLYGAQPNWQFLTGTPAQVAALWKSFGVSYEKVADKPPLPTDWWTGKPLHYDVDHQDVVFVLGPNGDHRWIDQGTPDVQDTLPPTKLVRFLNDDGRRNLVRPEQPTWTVGDVEQGIAYVTGQSIG